MPKPVFFSPMFRVKLETMLRVVQAHGGNLYRKFGQDVSQSAFDDLFKDALKALFIIREDDAVNYSELPEEWECFWEIISNEFNRMNRQVRALYSQNLPTVILINKFNLYIASTCDKVVDELNRKFASLQKAKP